MTQTEACILKNLADRVNPVAAIIAVSGVDDIVEGFKALELLVKQVLVVAVPVQFYDLRGAKFTSNLYRCQVPYTHSTPV
jgi:hypothetical protein